MEKLDLRKMYRHLYKPSARKVEVVDVPPLKFAAIDGTIEPGHSPGSSPAYERALEALYSISYTLKFESKMRAESPIDYTVMTLEGLWWVEDGEFDIKSPHNWCWTSMIMQPDHINEDMYQEALAQVREKKPNPALEEMRFEIFHEGPCIQIMHIGPFAEEPATLEMMDAFAIENNYILHGKHHEIYLSDPRRTKPENLKTVLRHPIKETRSS
jgi:hypothetical protein